MHDRPESAQPWVTAEALSAELVPIQQRIEELDKNYAINIAGHSSRLSQLEAEMERNHSLDLLSKRAESMVASADLAIASNKKFSDQMEGQRDHVETITQTVRQMQNRMTTLSEETDSQAQQVQDLKDTFVM